MAEGRIYVARESGTSEVDGQSYSFVKGVTRIREGHPLLKANPVFFEPVTLHVHYEWEQADAAPVRETPHRETATVRNVRGK